ncbi:MAG: beta-galactosidase trimerization domain-containing protein, partial [Planctomycetes bacterium]|nr:beta-galactosidase trimerization domain-containing protein [Planctomycetota bacterium]
RGIGKLLMESQREHDGIALLYSAVSNHVSTLTPELPTLADTLNAFPDLIEDAGYQYRTIAPDEVDAERLQRQATRAFYLPYVQAMSTREANELTRFVEAGGLVIADLRPAVADEHGKPHARSPLDEVFGVEQSTEQAKPIRGVVTIELPVGAFRGRLGLRFSDASLRVTAGQAHATVTAPPLLHNTTAQESARAVIINRYGRGTAVLLNFSVNQYGVEARASQKTRRLLRELLSTHGISPDVKLSPSLPGTHLYRFRQGVARYVGLLRNPPGVNVPGHDHGARDIAQFRPEQFEISFPERSHLYDVRAGRYLGLLDRIERTERRPSAFLVAALPYRAERLEVTNMIQAERIARAGDVVRFEARLHVDGESSAVQHVFHVEVLDPQGHQVPPYASNQVAVGACTFEIPFAFSDAEGRWTVVVRDVATGMTGRTSIELRPSL